jgi:replicative DNA helicase
MMEDQADYVTEVDKRSHENEIALLGSVLNGAKMPEFVHSNHFQWHAFGWAWKAARLLEIENITPDAITLGDALEREGKLAEFGYGMFTGRAAISRLRDFGQPENVDSYAQNVVDYANKREIAAIMTQGAYWAKNGRRAMDITTDVTTLLAKISNPLGTKTISIKDALSEAWDATNSAAQGQAVCVPSGYIDLDHLLDGGYSGGDLIIIAGRPGTGKTALLASMIDNMSKAHKKVLCFSLEMSNRQIAMRLLAMNTGITYGEQKTGKVKDWEVYQKGNSDLSVLPIALCDVASISVSQARREILAENAKGKIDCVLFDYIQLGGNDKKHDRRDQDIAEITQGLKAIAKDFDIPVIAAAQLNREVEKRASQKPILSDLAESSSLEKDADLIHFLYRNPERQNVTEVITAKNRNGEVGSIELIYRANLTRFDNASSRTIHFDEPHQYKD